MAIIESDLRFAFGLEQRLKWLLLEFWSSGSNHNGGDSNNLRHDSSTNRRTFEQVDPFGHSFDDARDGSNIGGKSGGGGSDASKTGAKSNEEPQYYHHLDRVILYQSKDWHTTIHIAHLNLDMLTKWYDKMFMHDVTYKFELLKSIIDHYESKYNSNIRWNKIK